MKFFATILLAATASAHYTFPALVANGAATQQWQYVRKTTNYQSNGPVTDVCLSIHLHRLYVLTQQTRSHLTRSAATSSPRELAPQAPTRSPLARPSGSLPRPRSLTLERSSSTWLRYRVARLRPTGMEVETYGSRSLSRDLPSAVVPSHGPATERPRSPSRSQRASRAVNTSSGSSTLHSTALAQQEAHSSISAALRSRSRYVFCA